MTMYDYVKNKLGENNNSKIKLSTDGIDLTNADVGEKVGDNSLGLDLKPAVEIGIPAIVAGISTPVVVGVVELPIISQCPKNRKNN